MLAPGAVELKIPARAELIPVAKRVASSLGGQLGFTLEALDELNIAVAQACAAAVEDANEAWGGGEVRLTFSSSERGITVDVEAVGPKSQTAVTRMPERAGDDEVRRLAQEMIRCFVDDFRSSIEPRRGRVRFRMVKYLIG